MSLTGKELLRRTFNEVVEDDCLGLAAQLSYYFFLALFPAVLFLLALASFFPLHNLTDDLARTAGPFMSPEVLQLIQDQMRRLAKSQNGGLLTVGVLGALWSSSAALVSIVDALNRAYDVTEGRPWWRVRLTAIALTIGVAFFVLMALTLVLAGPSLATYLGDTVGWGSGFKWAWLILQWPLAFFLVSTIIGVIYYVGPDVQQEWVWVSPGAVAATALWLGASLIFKLYIAKFTDYNASYGAVGAVIVLLLWFYVSGLALLVGAEMNAELEHASPTGKAPGEKVPGEKADASEAAVRSTSAVKAARTADMSDRTAVQLTPSPIPGARREGPAAGFVLAAIVLLARTRKRFASGVSETQTPPDRPADRASKGIVS